MHLHVVHCTAIYFLRVSNIQSTIGRQPCMHARWNKIQQLDKAGQQYSSPWYVGSGFLYALSVGAFKGTKWSKIFHGHFHLFLLSMQWSGLTFSLYSGFVQHIHSVSCSALQRMLTFYPALKTQPELYIVILTFNPILLCPTSCPWGPLRWLITARLQLQSPFSQIALREAESVNTCTRECVCMNRLDLWVSLSCLCVSVCVLVVLRQSFLRLTTTEVEFISWGSTEQNQTL